MKKDDDIKEPDLLTHLLEKSQMDYCAICGKCHSVCPTYRETWIETFSPRGRLNVIMAFLKGEIKPGSKFAESIMTCLLCGACATTCPREVKPNEAVQYIRSHPEFEKYKSGLESLVLKNFITSQRQVKTFLFPLKVYQNTGLKALLHNSVMGIMPKKLRLMESAMPHISWKPLLRRVKEVETPEIKNGNRVLFFPGCAMNFFLAEAAYSTIKLLLKLGTEVIIPRGIYCCGAPHSHEGELQTSLSLAEKNLSLFSKYEFDFIITDCSACGASLKSYPDLFFNNPDKKLIASRNAYKTLDISEYLDLLKINWETVKVPEDLKGIRITFDNPCELRHAQKIKSTPADILRQIKDIKFQTLPEADWCCGGAGLFSLREPESAEKIFLRKKNELEKLDIDALLTLNPGCYFQWKSGLARHDVNVMVLYYTELLQKLTYPIIPKPVNKLR